MDMSSNCENSNTGSVGVVVIEPASSASFSYGLSAVGSAAGLIYGLTKAENKRWWAILLYMAGGSLLGSGVGYAIDTARNNK